MRNNLLRLLLGIALILPINCYGESPPSQQLLTTIEKLKELKPDNIELSPILIDEGQIIIEGHATNLRGLADYLQTIKSTIVGEVQVNEIRPAELNGRHVNHFIFSISLIEPFTPKVLPLAPIIALEILELKNFTPGRGVNDDEWSRLAYQKKQTDCFALLKRVEKSIGFAFVKDKTGRNRTDRSFMFPSNMKCERESIWIVDYVGDDDGTVIITKYSISGDMLYRIRFERPYLQKDGFIGENMKSLDGYLYFDWLYRNATAAKQQIRQILKVRLREPEGIGAAANITKAEECPKNEETMKTITHTKTTECPAATVTIEDEQYLERYQNCPAYIEGIQNESLFYQGKERARTSLPSLGNLFPKREDFQGWMVSHIQCKGDNIISVGYFNGGNCADCEQEVLYTFKQTGELRDSRLMH